MKTIKVTENSLNLEAILNLARKEKQFATGRSRKTVERLRGKRPIQIVTK